MGRGSAYFPEESSGPVPFRSAGVACPDTSRFPASVERATEKITGSASATLPVIFSVPPDLRLLTTVLPAGPSVGFECLAAGADPAETNVTGNECR